MITMLVYWAPVGRIFMWMKTTPLTLLNYLHTTRISQAEDTKSSAQIYLRLVSTRKISIITIICAHKSMQ